ncbi:hypothetical protein HYU96_00705 [Candidatus Daviesbacteria bacterium]|nr:hypothetical protein [Candidatus Daviesbacteria bacterium]
MLKILLPILVILALAGFFYFKFSLSTKEPVSPAAKDTENIKTYQSLDFQFQYGQEWKVLEDSEEEFDERGNGTFRKNFTGYVGYEPGKFLGAVVTLDQSGSYEINPFTVWIFDNPQNLTIEAWHHDYWYYPFVWGDFTDTGKFVLAPQDEATVSGQPGKSGIIDYREGKPKFIYVAKDGKMYLFRIIGSEGEKILQSFKFN